MEIGKNYTEKELFDIYGPFWMKKLNLSKIPVIKNKKEVFNFQDFEEESKEVYIKIKAYIQQYNQNQKINLWATGSRVKGSWKTREEADQLAKDYNTKKIKYSDYDFLTDAKFLPSNRDIERFLGENILVDGRRLDHIKAYACWTDEKIFWRAVPVD
jgi:hypothetical protein